MRATLAVAAFLLSCAPSKSLVMVADDPVSGISTAYGTVFLDSVSRLVLSAPKGPGLVRATLWTDVTDGDCSSVFVTVDGHEVRPGEVEGAVVQTPSGADQTVVFAMPPAVVRGLSDGAGQLTACGRSWSLDDDDRDVLLELLEVAGQE